MNKNNMNKDKEEFLVPSKKNLVKCPKCGEDNIKSMEKCLMCGEALKGAKSCPRCAKINQGDAKKCVNCGFPFTGKKKAVLFSLALSIGLLVVLFVLLVLGQKTIVYRFTKTFRFLSIGLIVLILISMFTYGKKEKVDYAAKYNGEVVVFKGKKFFSLLLVLVGLVLACFCVYYFFFMNK